MNFPFHIPSHFNSPEQAALYYSSLCFTYQYYNDLHHQTQNMFFLPPLNAPLLSNTVNQIKKQAPSQRPTDDMNQKNIRESPPVKVEVKIEENINQQQEQDIDNKSEDEEKANRVKLNKLKNLKKNTESNLINNVFSYICSENKSHRIVNQLVSNRPDRKAIFYIFANNLKRLNGKYVNRKNVKEICEIVPKQKHFKMLSKSIKRLKILAMNELRVMLRKLIFSYLRGPESILPLLTSKKICKVSFHQHMNRRRNLIQFLKTMLKDFS